MKNFSWLNFLFLFLFAFTQLADAAGRQAMIIDTDVGRDDLIGIMYLAKDPRVEIKAITIESNGDAHCAAAFHNMIGLMDLLGLKVPLACGSEEPVAGGHLFPQPILNREDVLSGASSFLPKIDVSVKHDAVALLIKTLEAAKEPVTILAIGPLTNIARAFLLQPSIKKKIAKVFIMGGAVHVRGNIDNTVAHASEVAEWNIYFDPEAARVVFANLPVALVPLDATNQAPMDGRFLAMVGNGGYSVVYEFLYKMLKVSEASLRSGLWYFWDPLAAVLSSDESFCEFKIEKLRVLVEPEKMSGATVVDKVHGAPVSVCEKVHVEAFEKQLLAIIRS